MVDTDKGRLEQRHEFVTLRARGLSLSKCAKRLRISRTTACSWNRELEGEIERLAAVELDALRERFRLTQRARLTDLGQTLRRLHREAKRRDLSALTDDQLLKHVLEYTRRLVEEFPDTPASQDGAAAPCPETESGPQLDRLELARLEEELRNASVEERAILRRTATTALQREKAGVEPRPFRFVDFAPEALAEDYRDMSEGERAVVLNAVKGELALDLSDEERRARFRAIREALDLPQDADQ